MPSFRVKRGTQMSNNALARSQVLRVVLFCLLIPTTSLGFISRSQTEGPTRNSPETKSLVYVNKKYGFRVSLPKSWKRYSIRIGEWEGGDGRSYSRGEVMPPPIKGPFITIRHPLWTESNPRQDIPIMVFTRAQWNQVEEGKFVFSAGPIGPSELARNSKYVFALPPRWVNDSLEGWKEAAEIIQTQPLQALPVISEVPDASVSSSHQLRPFFLYLAEAKLISPRVGWVEASSVSSDGAPVSPEHLFWTTDNGVTWRDITPPNSQQQRISDVFFYDSRHGWAMVSPPDRDLAESNVPMAIVTTSDGGQTWSALPFEKSRYPRLQSQANPSYFFFLDSAHGLFMWAVQHAGNAGVLLSTTDGGESWSQLSPPPSAAQIDFVSNHIWFTVGGELNDELWITKNGGANWNKVTVPLPNGLLEQERSFLKYKFWTANEGIVTASIQRSATEYMLLTYVTQNGGKSWTHREFDDIWSEPCIKGQDVSWTYGSCPEFVNPSDAWLRRDNRLLSTIDGGATFRDITPGPGTIRQSRD